MAVNRGELRRIELNRRNVAQTAATTGGGGSGQLVELSFVTVK